MLNGILRNEMLALAAGLLLVCGCSTVRDARKNIAGEDRPRGERTPTAAEMGLKPGKAVELAELERIALSCQPRIRQAVNAVEKARLAAADAGAAQLPTAGMSFRHGRQTDNVRMHDQDAHTSGQWGAGVNLEWLIYDFGQTRYAVRQAVEKYNASLLDLRSRQNEAVYQVRTAFFQLKRSQELDKVARETVSQYREHLDRVKVMREVGKSTPYDQTKAEVDYHNAVLTSNRTASDIRTAWADLAAVLGLAEAVEFPCRPTQMHEYVLNLDKLMEKARSQDPELGALVFRRLAAEAFVEKTIRELYPSFKLSLDASARGDSLSLPWLWNLSGAAAVSETLFYGGRRLRAIRRAVADLNDSRAAIAQREQQLFRDLRRAVLQAELAQRQLQDTLLIEKQAGENFAIVNAQFNVGKVSSLERTDAQVSLSRAKAETVSARFNYQDALAAIAHLIGDGPAAENVSSAVPVEQKKSEAAGENR